MEPVYFMRFALRNSFCFLLKWLVYCCANTENPILFLVCSGSTIQNKQMFNIICELPETVARTLVPRMRVVKGTGKAINYLTPPRILLALITVWLRQGRWFDEQVALAILVKHFDPSCNWQNFWTDVVLLWQFYCQLKHEKT